MAERKKDSQMTRQLACPSCGKEYAALYFRARSVCPYCKASVATDLRMISFLETLVAVPVLWMVMTLLRVHLGETTGLICGLLLLIPMQGLHRLVVRQYVTARIDEKL